MGKGDAILDGYVALAGQVLQRPAEIIEAAIDAADAAGAAKKELQAAKKEHGRLKSESARLAGKINQSERRLEWLEQTKTALDEAERDIESRRLELLRREEGIRTAMESGRATRIEICQKLPRKDDSPQLKKAWYYLLIALTADGGGNDIFRELRSDDERE